LFFPLSLLSESPLLWPLVLPAHLHRFAPILPEYAQRPDRFVKPEKPENDQNRYGADAPYGPEQNRYCEIRDRATSEKKDNLREKYLYNDVRRVDPAVR